jgi:hypothetical protein
VTSKTVCHSFTGVSLGPRSPDFLQPIRASNKPFFLFSAKVQENSRVKFLPKNLLVHVGNPVGHGLDTLPHRIGSLSTEDRYKVDNSDDQRTSGLPLIKVSALTTPRSSHHPLTAAAGGGRL